MIEFSVQCELMNGGQHIVTWIPMIHKGHTISKGDLITLKEEDGKWTVIALWSVRPTAEVIERSRDWKNTRKASDI